MLNTMVNKNIIFLFILAAVAISTNAKSQIECIKIYNSAGYISIATEINNRSSNLHRILGVLSANTDEYEFTKDARNDLMMLSGPVITQLHVASAFNEIYLKKSKQIDPEFLQLIRFGQTDINIALSRALGIITYTAAIKNIGINNELRSAQDAVQKFERMVNGCPAE